MASPIETDTTERFRGGVHSPESSSNGRCPGLHPTMRLVRAPALGFFSSYKIPVKVSELACTVGDRIHTKETVAVLDTDKVSVQVQSHMQGVISKVLVTLGQEVHGHQAIYALYSADTESAPHDSRRRLWAKRRQDQLDELRREEDLNWESAKTKWTPHWTWRRLCGEQSRRSSQFSSVNSFTPRATSKQSLSNKGQKLGVTLQVLSATTHYDALYVKRSASTAELNRAFRKLALLVHPDHSSSDRASEAFVRLRQAHTVLSQPHRRREYDAWLTRRGL